MGPTYDGTFMTHIGLADCLIYMKFGNIYLLDIMHSPLQQNNDLPLLSGQKDCSYLLTENTIYNQIGFGWAEGFLLPLSRSDCFTTFLHLFYCNPRDSAYIFY